MPHGHSEPWTASHGGDNEQILTSLSNLTFAVRPSRCSSFWLSKSSAYRCPMGWKGFSLPTPFVRAPPYGDERPEEGGVLYSLVPSSCERSRNVVLYLHHDDAFNQLVASARPRQQTSTHRCDMTLMVSRATCSSQCLMEAVDGGTEENSI